MSLSSGDPLVRATDLAVFYSFLDIVFIDYSTMGLDGALGVLLRPCELICRPTPNSGRWRLTADHRVILFTDAAVCLANCWDMVEADVVLVLE